MLLIVLLNIAASFEKHSGIVLHNDDHICVDNFKWSHKNRRVNRMFNNLINTNGFQSSTFNTCQETVEIRQCESSKSNI